MCRRRVRGGSALFCGLLYPKQATDTVHAHEELCVPLKFEPTGTVTRKIVHVRCLLSGDQKACATVPN